MWDSSVNILGTMPVLENHLYLKMPLLPKVVFNYKVCTIYNKWNILIFIMNKLIKDYKIYVALIVVDRLIRENELS